MATETDKTAYRAHAYSYSIIAVVAGLFAALAIVAVLLLVNYRPQNDVDTAPTTLTNATKTGEAPRSR